MASSPDYLTVYKHPDRATFLKETRDAPPFFDPRTSAWIVTNPELVREFLASQDLVSALVIETQQPLSESLAMRLGPIMSAARFIPLFLDGEEHAALRRRLSQQIASRRSEVAQWMQQELPTYVEPLRTNGRVEMVSQLIEPMIRDLMQTVVDIELPPDLQLFQSSLVFDKFTSVSRRSQVARLLEKLHRHVRDVMGPDATPEEVGMRFGLIVIARDATAGTFGESLVQVLRGTEGQPLSDVRFPKFPPQTGVPFVDRIAEVPFSAAGMDFEKGARFRLVLQTYSQSPPDQHHRFFGAGAHSCLGRSTATELWSAFTILLNQLSSRLRVVSYELEENNFVLNVPKRFEVEVTN